MKNNLLGATKNHDPHHLINNYKYFINRKISFVFYRSVRSHQGNHCNNKEKFVWFYGWSKEMKIWGLAALCIM